MIVADIYDDAKEVLGFNHQDKIFRRITDAIEALANKGSWEPLLAYVMIPVSDNILVYLPDSVEVPIRVTLDNNPAFARGRMYEFTMNGPGPFDERVEWSWEDLGEYNYKYADNEGNVTSEARSTRRVIRLNKTGNFVRMLVRLRTTKILTLQDWIPLHSKLAILMMLKALESYRRGSPQDFQLAQGQEAQALKFLQEEQQSRASYQEIAQAMDKPPIIGYAYHSGNMVVVADIYDEASMIVGGVGKSHVFDAITEAIECLANKGQWDAMTGYLTMAPNSNLVGLPRQVEIPIRINIENNPTMARSRLFEFTVNGPGTDLGEVTTLTWEDQGSGPLMVPLTTPSPINVGGGSGDAGKKVTVTGIDTDDKEQSVTYTIPANEDQEQAGSRVTWKEVYTITKDITQGPVSVFANYGLAAFLYPDETAPLFRQIKLSKVASEIRIMFRRSSLKVTSKDDIIPLKSRSAILNMMRSLQLYKSTDLNPEKLQMAQALEVQSLKYLQEEEQSRLAYIQASLKDSMPALGRNYNSRGVLTAGDVFDDAADIFGPIGRERLFDKITEATEALANKSQWDGMDGYVDILSDGRGYISLPPQIEVPVGMNFCNTPAQMKSRWYEFHINGIGSRCIPCDSWMDVGEYPIIVEPPSGVRLYAISSFEADRGASVRAYGYDQTGSWIRSIENNVYVDGEIIPVSVRTNTDAPEQIPVTSHEFAQISRVSKSVTDMQIELWGGTSNYTQQDFISPPVANDPPTTPLFLAYYEPDETEPMFRRIKVPANVTWVKMRFRKTTLKITKMSDVINMRSKTALVTMLRSLKALDVGDINASQGFETVAVKLISEEQMSRNPAETFDIQYDTATCFADPLQGQY
jgi:hypothetical protein